MVFEMPVTTVKYLQELDSIICPTKRAYGSSRCTGHDEFLGLASGSSLKGIVKNIYNLVNSPCRYFCCDIPKIITLMKPRGISYLEHGNTL
jgi:hypothetical protein